MLQAQPLPPYKYVYKYSCAIARANKCSKLKYIKYQVALIMQKFQFPKTFNCVYTIWKINKQKNTKQN